MPLLLYLAVIVENRFDVVAIGIQDERGIIPWPIFFAIAGFAIVLGAGCQSRFIKCLHRFLAFDLKGDMSGHDFIFLDDPKAGLAALHETNRFAVLHILSVADRT